MTEHCSGHSFGAPSTAPPNGRWWGLARVALAGKRCPMSGSSMPWPDHELVVSRTGSRSGLPVVIAVHSTALGPAAGGCRIWRYPRWQDGLEDALRLSAAMTAKSAAADLDKGGGKAVVALPEGTDLTPAFRREVLLDVADAVESLGGLYATAPDVGTSPEDMAVISERTDHVFCTPTEAGGSGDSSRH